MANSSLLSATSLSPSTRHSSVRTHMRTKYSVSKRNSLSVPTWSLLSTTLPPILLRHLF
nr:hypothetical protein I308_02503 [Cryptococcus tetragattii IND107]